MYYILNTIHPICQVKAWIPDGEGVGADSRSQKPGHQRSDGKRLSTVVGSLKTEVGDQKTEARSRGTDVGRRRSELRGDKRINARAN